MNTRNFIMLGLCTFLLFLFLNLLWLDVLGIPFSTDGASYSGMKFSDRLVMLPSFLIPANIWVSLFHPFLIWILLPLSFFYMAYDFHNRLDFALYSTFAFMFGMPTLLAFSIVGFLSQALSLFFLFLFVNSLLNENKNAIVFGILTIASHSASVILMTGVIFVWLWKTKQKDFYLLSIFFGLIILNLLLFTRFSHYLSETKPTEMLSTLFSINPVVLLLCFMGLYREKQRHTLYFIVLILLGIGLVTLPLKSCGRGMLSILPFLTLYFPEKVNRINNQKIYNVLQVFIALWFLVMLLLYLAGFSQFEIIRSQIF